MRNSWIPVAFVLAGCATSGSNGNIAIEASSGGLALAGANCQVTNWSGSWTVVTPGVAPVGSPNGDLRVVCDKPGFRTSEVVFRPGGGGGINPNLGVGIGGGSGPVGVGLGVGIPIGNFGGGGGYPPRINVEMRPQ